MHAWLFLLWPIVGVVGNIWAWTIDADLTVLSAIALTLAGIVLGPLLLVVLFVANAGGYVLIRARHRRTGTSDAHVHTWRADA